MTSLTVGFDLDMTLVDSRPGIHASLCALADEYRTFIDADLVVERLGPKLEDELANWFPREAVAGAADRYRELYGEIGVVGCSLLPGAAAAVDAVARAGGRTIVVTAKFEPNAVACLAHVGVVVDRVYGWRHGPGKGTTLAEESAAIYVGDTPSDIAGARTAAAFAVGVTTGPHGHEELHAAGADVVLASLLEFPEVLRSTAASP
ncbi:MAG TPA: HAD hydrolase-like protein [Acidimicrobiia bacterium]|nr:HAD hydrolase-like protein [Acidimicrobiia bacterium]